MNKNTLFVLLIVMVFTMQLYAQATDDKPLEVYTDVNYSGTSQLYEKVTPHKDLGVLDNQIKSFKLKMGYMATFASNSDGTGYSRVFIAQDADVEVPVMPAYLNGTVSFIRIMTWHPDVTKRGWCGTGNPLEDLIATNSSWFYNWDTGVDSTPTIEYVPMRHNQYWPDFGPANTKEGYTHFLAYNEPSHKDQANMTAQQCIDNWKYFMESGLRLGSIAPDNPYNPILGEFMRLAEAQNLRVDFIPVHFYDNKLAGQWEGDLTNIYNTYHRPIWITEGNQGANWTSNSFPVNNPDILNDANANYHKNNIKEIVDVLERLPFIERYSLYNWVEPRRSFIINIDDFFRSTNPDWVSYTWLQTAILNPIATWVDGSGDTDYRVLTPAGEYYANHVSNKAYNPAVVYIPTWKPFVETLSYSFSADYNGIVVKWTGINNDLVNKYIVERKLEGENSFSIFYESTNYSDLSVADIVHPKAEYRMKVVGKDNVQTVYSSVLLFTQEVIPSSPTDFVGNAVSTSIINLTWPEVERAKIYNLKRANSIDGTYQIIGSLLTGTSFQDTGLEKNKTYYYAVSAINSGGESSNSGVIAVKTLDISIPEKISNFTVGSGDAQVNLKWNFMYDAQFYIKRSTSVSGPFTTIATLSPNTTQYKDLAVVNGSTYYYTISAFNSLGEGPDSGSLVAKPNQGLFAYYDFNEVKTTTPYDQWGNHASNLSGTASWVSGKTGNGIHFDGSSSSYMDIEDGVMQGLTNFSISTWVKLDANNNWNRIFDFGASTNNYMFLTPKNGANGNLRFAFKNGGDEEQINTGITLQTGVWTHVAVTLNGSVGIIYVNGIEVGRNETMTLNPSLLGNTIQNYIGKSQFNDPFLNGTIDEFRIYSVALTSSEIVDLVSSTPIPPDDDNDSVYNYDDQCPDTPAGETVDANGCSSSQIDTDQDGVMDNIDQCSNTPSGETANANGCSSTQIDDDNDGVSNALDQCPNTPTGETVSANGCFVLPSTNFAITQVGETCPNKNNGQISINATATYNYIATVNNVVHNFTDNKLVLSDLAPGIYTVCITIQGKTFEQCYTIEIPKSNTITGKTMATSDKLLVEIQSGTAPYQVVVNGQIQYETNKANFDVTVKLGDLLEVKTAKACEGTFSKTITLFDAVKAFPNPTSGQFDIYLPTNKDSVTIGIYSADAKLISKSNYPIDNGKVHLNLEKEPTGIYIIKVQSNPVETIQIIKK